MYEELNCFEEALKHFGTRVEVICAMELGGRINAEDAYQMIKDEMKEVKACRGLTRTMTAKIYESPDGGKTVYVREMGSDEPRRQIYPDLMNEVQATSPYNDGWTHKNSTGINGHLLCLKDSKINMRTIKQCLQMVGSSLMMDSGLNVLDK